MKKLFTIAFLFVLVLPSFPKSKLWVKTYGDVFADTARSVDLIPGGEFFLVGNNELFACRVEVDASRYESDRGSRLA